MSACVSTCLKSEDMYARQRCRLKPVQSARVAVESSDWLSIVTHATMQIERAQGAWHRVCAMPLSVSLLWASASSQLADGQTSLRHS